MSGPRSPLNDPVGTIRRYGDRDVEAYAIRWNMSPDFGWRVIYLSGSDSLEPNSSVKKWSVVYRPPAVGK